MLPTGKFYYSRKAAQMRGRVNKCMLTDGRIEQYTEWVSKGGKPMSQWDDLIYLGKGIVYLCNGVQQVTDKQVREWQTKNRRKFLRKRIMRLASIGHIREGRVT